MSFDSQSQQIVNNNKDTLGIKQVKFTNNVKL